MARSPVQLRDVAASAGVSAATVSRTLNGDSRVDAELQRRVMAAVEDLGYRRNMLARNLRRQRLDALGVIVSDIENPHFSEMVKVIEDEGFRRGYRVLVCGTNESSDKQSTYLKMLADERVAGVIISPSDPAGPEIGELLDAEIPVVAVDREVSDPRADAIITDNVNGVARATRLLIENGHTAIAYIGGRAGVETGAERRQGYRKAMRAAKLPQRTAVGDFRFAGGARAATELLTSAEPPTALVVANNLMTLGTLQAAQDLRVRIGRDLALITVDDPPWTKFLDPPLTAVAQPISAIACEALEVLVRRIDGDDGPPHRSVHPLTLVERGSSGPPPRAPRSPRRKGA